MFFRPRLYSIPTEKALFDYFEKNARYLESEQIYTCGGVCSDDPCTLFQKLIKVWKEDIENYKQESIEEALNFLNGNDSRIYIKNID